MIILVDADMLMSSSLLKDLASKHRAAQLVQVRPQPPKAILGPFLLATLHLGRCAGCALGACVHTAGI